MEMNSSKPYLYVRPENPIVGVVAFGYPIALDSPLTHRYTPRTYILSDYI